MEHELHDHQMPAPEMAAQNLRHELRTPINHIVGYSEMLLEEAADQEHPDRYQALHTIVAAGRSMLALISERLSELGGEVPLSELRLLYGQLRPHLLLVEQVCDLLQHAPGASDDVSFQSDLVRIRTAGNHLAQLVSDLANAVPTDWRESGAVAPAPQEVLHQRQQIRLNEGRILVVDDNDANRDMLLRRLERLGYSVGEVNGGQAALDLLADEPFDLILLDIMMPEMDGYTVLARLKSDPQLSGIPVIVLSALDDTGSVVRGIELGADDYLPKPFDPVLLKARISACLFKKRLRDIEIDYLRQIEDEKRRADDLLHVVIPIGVALSNEKDFNQLLERIVVEAQELCNADGGTLYLRTDDQRLRFVIVRNRSLNIAMGGASGKDIPFAPLRLYEEASGAPNSNYVVAHATLSGQTINLPDAYDAAGYDFSGTRDFDTRTGYRSTSILTVPLRDGMRRVIGVLQLINAMDRHGHVIHFDKVAEQMVESLGALAAAALAAYAREQELRQEIDSLKIEIDLVKKQREVEQITSSSYFSTLQERARQMRGSSNLNFSNGDGESANAAAARRKASSELRVERFMVDGQELVARVQGSSSRRLLLLIHGWSSSWYALSPLLPTLSERYHCVAVDLPGYGESPKLPVRASIPRYADLLAELIRQLSPRQPAVLVGHSMGGMISLTMALRTPELIERMVLLCPTISGKLSRWINTVIFPITLLERSRMANRVVATLEPYMMRMTDGMMRPASFADRSGINQRDYVRLRADARRPGQGLVRAECFSAMRENDLRERLKHIVTPAQVIWGMEDNTVPLRDASVVASEWEDAELQMIPNAGHWPQFETPEQTRRYMRGFLNKPLKLLKAQF